MPKRILKKRFGALALLSFAILGIFIDQRRSPSLSELQTGISENIIDTYSSGIESKEFNEEGKLQNHVMASDAKHYRISDVSLLANPRLLSYANSGHIWETRAPSGRVRAGGSIYDLWGGVETKRQDNSGNIQNDNGITITMETLSYFSDTATARTDKKVIIDSAIGRTNGVGLEANLEQETVKLTSKVTGTYVLDN